MVQTNVRALKREFETLTMKRNEKVDDYSTEFVSVVPSLRDLGEKLDNCDVVSSHLMSVPKEYDLLSFFLEQFGDLNTMRLEEAIGHLKVH